MLNLDTVGCTFLGLLSFVHTELLFLHYHHFTEEPKYDAVRNLESLLVVILAFRCIKFRVGQVRSNI